MRRSRAELQAAEHVSGHLLCVAVLGGHARPQAAWPYSIPLAA
ncbi:hypothetical protein L083_0692 [Actinoplanes sp. N902-109]|nr:hypothetical protein L083_0692 [Actinoplanes sp. N902-109]